MQLRLFVFTLVLVLAPSLASAAPVIYGGSTLLTPAGAAQLQSWLGAGDISLTNIFSKTPGDGQGPAQFHAAVDGMGPTFSIIEILPSSSGQSGFAGGHGVVSIGAQIVGGYNPVSWETLPVYGYHITLTNAERTAFIFNLTNNLVQYQNLIGQGNSETGKVQTLNAIDRGPTFGMGTDLGIYGANLQLGLAYNQSYGGTTFGQNIIESPTIGYNTYNDSLRIGRIEVFMIGAAPAAAPMPEPASLLVWSLVGAAGALACYRRKRR